MEKRLYKIKKGAVIDGVCGGLAEYFGMDPTLMRIIWVIFTFAGGSGILAYIIAMCIMPEAPKKKKKDKEKDMLDEQLEATDYDDRRN